MSTPLTQRAGRLVGESCRRCELWMRCLWTSSSAEGSVQKWSAVFILVYSRAQGPTAGQTEAGNHSSRKSALPSTTSGATHCATPPLQPARCPRVLLRRSQLKALEARDREQVSFDGRDAGRLEGDERSSWGVSHELRPESHMKFGALDHLPNKDARMGPSTGSIRRASFS